MITLMFECYHLQLTAVIHLQPRRSFAFKRVDTSVLLHVAQQCVPFVPSAAQLSDAVNGFDYASEDRLQCFVARRSDIVYPMCLCSSLFIRLKMTFIVLLRSGNEVLLHIARGDSRPLFPRHPLCLLLPDVPLVPLILILFIVPFRERAPDANNGFTMPPKPCYRFCCTSCPGATFGAFCILAN